MKTNISDKDVLQLLKTLKNFENDHPQDLIESRRDLFTKQAAAMAVLMKAGINGVNATSGTASIGTSIGSMLETMLVVVILAEAGIATYLYREKIAAFLHSALGPRVERVVNSPDNSFTDIIATDESTAEFPTETPTAATTTPPGLTPSVQENNDESNRVEATGISQITSTPEPDGGNNGLHLGQTQQPSKQPKSTKEPKNNNKK